MKPLIGMVTRMESYRCKMAAIEIDDPRGKGLLAGVAIEVEDPRCRNLKANGTIGLEESWSNRVGIAMEDARCQNLGNW